MNIKTVLGIVIVLGIVFAIASTFSSEQLDQADGGNAQVIYVPVPTEGIDQGFADTYKTIAEGNQANAEGDASTTLANAQARNLDGSTWLGWIGGIFILGIIAFFVMKAS